MLEPAARSLADGHGDAPTAHEDGKAGGVADPGEILGAEAIELGEEEDCMVLRLDTAVSFEAWRDLAMRRFGSTPEDVSRCRELSLHFDVGEGRVDRFDLRRMAHLLSDEFEIEVTALRCSDEQLRLYGESELKMEIIPHRVPVKETSETSEALEPDEVEIFAPMEPLPMDFSEVVEHQPAAQVASCLDDEDSFGIDPVEFEEDDDSLEVPLAVEPSFEEADLEPVTPVLVVEEPDEALTTDVFVPADEEDEVIPSVLAVDEQLVESGTGPSHGGWTSRPLIRDEQPTAGQRQVMVVDKTLRSGGRVSFAGDVIIYGDVNAGAQVEAEGNIVVLGALRGSAHAGARGDQRSIVLAFDLRPTHLSVAEARACLEPAEVEQGSSRLQGLLRRTRPAAGGFTPEIAHLRDGQIVCEPYTGRFPNS